MPSPPALPEVLELPAIALAPGGACRVDADGVITTLDRDSARDVVTREAHVICHAARVLRRLDAGRSRPLHLDIAELFAFVLPARIFVPTATGLARALSQTPPATGEDEPAFLLHVAQHLLAMLSPRDAAAPRMARLAATMGRAGWRWAPFVLARLGQPQPQPSPQPRPQPGGFDTWNELPEWEDGPPRGKPSSGGVSASEARARLFAILGEGREQRPAQADYAEAAALMFAPRSDDDDARIVLAEAGTGIGKTLGYVAPASLYAARSDAPVWISTFTRNLQRQIDQELSRVYPDPVEKAQKVVVRKGRENYLCLLNYQEAQARVALAPGSDTVLLGLVARWIAATRDGDLLGGDFPSFLISDNPFIRALTDRRGECIYSACQHYRRCFIERSIRKAASADIVIGNHALVMVRAALAARSLDDRDDTKKEGQPDARQDEGLGHIIFDEAHHIFDAADSAFAVHLTGMEGAELRRWIRGREGEGSSRMRGLAERCGDLVAGDKALEEALEAANRAAGILPFAGWGTRVIGGAARGPFERFLAGVRTQVALRNDQADTDYDSECETLPLADGIADAAGELKLALGRLVIPLNDLARGLNEKLVREAETLESPEKARLMATSRGIARRAKLVVPGWIDMLGSLGNADNGGFVDWFAVQRAEGREMDMGFFRHHLDPTIPFAAEVLARVSGALVTSATLRDRPPDNEISDLTVGLDWRSAEIRTGAAHLAVPPIRRAFDSPFDYPARTRVLVIGDVPQDDVEQRAAAYAALIRASSGGALGLFTAIRRLRAIHKRLLPMLEKDDLSLFAQHVDGIDTGTLVDLFRVEEDASLIGTDALRDGVDVPGRSLRLVIFDRVPWPRPDILFKARRKAFGGRRYDEMMTRLRLRQAFGRLIRSAEDRGIFCILERRTPTRLLSGLPDGVLPARVGLAEAVRVIGSFFGEPGASPSPLRLAAGTSGD